MLLTANLRHLNIVHFAFDDISSCMCTEAGAQTKLVAPENGVMYLSFGRTRIVNGRRRNRQKNVMVHPHAEAHTGKLILDDELDHRRRKVGREGKNGHRQKSHDEWRLLPNLPPDYGEQDVVRAAGRRRRPSLTTTSNRNFNELWIKQQLSTTPV